jgi:hypothetical protein
VGFIQLSLNPHRRLENLEIGTGLAIFYPTVTFLAGVDKG